MAATPLTIDFADIQGIVRFGYRRLTEASFLLLKIRDAVTARSWLKAAPISSAVELENAPAAALQIAFTCEGLKALGIAPEILAGFSPEFLSGMAGDASRSRRLGDVGSNSPQSWLWGASRRVPHVLLMVYAQPGALQSWIDSVKTAQWDAAFEILTTLSTSDLQGVEPFGFADGISQPALDWKRERSVKGDQLEYGNLISLGEFLLGYPNEYGKYTERPLLDSSDPHSGLLAKAEDVPDKRDLGRNGAYLVFRQLEQDVQGFWRFLDSQAHSDPQIRQALAEAMVGRKAHGDPLEPISVQPIAGIDAESAAKNQFTYDLDNEGVRCPFGAHVRRANPRNADLPDFPSNRLSWLKDTLGFGSNKFREDLKASARFHRLLRRGREYGPGLSPEQAITGAPDTNEHGIHFICLTANISRQFEFVQNAWLMNTKFDGLTEERDPLLGNREAVPGCAFADTFSLPQKSGLQKRIMNLPQFITVRGGAYFFLPSLSALRYFAAMYPPK
jgi:Dyp-type peroxidase family